MYTSVNLARLAFFEVFKKLKSLDPIIFLIFKANLDFLF